MLAELLVRAFINPNGRRFQHLVEFLSSTYKSDNEVLREYSGDISKYCVLYNVSYNKLVQKIKEMFYIHKHNVRDEDIEMYNDIVYAPYKQHFPLPKWDNVQVQICKYIRDNKPCLGPCFGGKCVYSMQHLSYRHYGRRVFPQAVL